jgi:hypothetical protein
VKVPHQPLNPYTLKIKPAFWQVFVTQVSGEICQKALMNPALLRVLASGGILLKTSLAHNKTQHAGGK